MIKVKDSNVIMTWKCESYNDKDSGPHNITELNPDFYQDNGTPMCECGDDMEYLHTHIKEN